MSPEVGRVITVWCLNQTLIQFGWITFLYAVEIVFLRRICVILRLCSLKCYWDNVILEMNEVLDDKCWCDVFRRLAFATKVEGLYNLKKELILSFLGKRISYLVILRDWLFFIRFHFELYSVFFYLYKGK